MGGGTQFIDWVESQCVNNFRGKPEIFLQTYPWTFGRNALGAGLYAWLPFLQTLRGNTRRC